MWLIFNSELFCFSEIKKSGSTTACFDDSVGQGRVREVDPEAFQWRHPQGQPPGPDGPQPIANHSESEPNFSDGHASHVHSGEF